jgi:acyl-CoA synthetase (AMP-forming)/AMP-acid ligase II
VARALLDQGVQPGQRVALALPNGLPMLELLYGIIRAGLIAVPIDIRRAAGLAAVVEDAEARLVFVQSDHTSIEVGPDVEVIDLAGQELGEEADLDVLIRSSVRGDARADAIGIPPHDVAVMLYTSGTTGEPKGVMLSHENWFYAALGLVLALDLMPDDVGLLSTPLTHASGFLFLALLLRGGRSILLRRWDPGEFLEAFAARRATTTFMVPTMLYGLLDTPEIRRMDFDSLRVLYYSSAPIDRDRLTSAIEVFGSRLTQSYGLIEAAMPASVLDRSDHERMAVSRSEDLLASAGREFLLSEIAIVDPDCSPVSDQGTGEILVRGPHVMRGYWKHGEASSDVLTDGWLRTGDFGYRDAEGYLYLTDRRADVIVSGGSTVSASRIERALAGHPAVRDVAVVAGPDDYWGEIPVAVVVPRESDSLQPAELLEYARSALSAAERPRRVVIERELPRNENGKLLRRQLRERFWLGRQRRIH